MRAMTKDTAPTTAPEAAVPSGADATPPSPPQPAVPEQEIGGPKGPDPTRYGDWERNGRCIDF